MQADSNKRFLNIVCLTGKSFSQVQSQWKAARKKADLFELRLDLIPFAVLLRLKPLLRAHASKLILSHRGALGLKKKQQLLFWFLHLCPRFLDWDMEEEAANHRPGSCFVKNNIRRAILSYHNYESLTYLSAMLRRLHNTRPACAHRKIAVTPKNALESQKVLFYQKKHSLPSTTFLAMGERFSWTRLLTPLLGGRLNYLAADGAVKGAKGQLSISEQSLYHPNPRYWFALVGDPVKQSVSHVYHNKFFQKKNIPALYCKIALKKEEALLFLKKMRKMPFLGYSVTMPLKETLLCYPQELEEEARLIGALNTLYLQDGVWRGANTDGLGAIKALQKIVSIHGKRWAIAGAGGTARAIGYAALQAGASSVRFFCRSPSKIEGFAAKLGCQASFLDEMFFSPLKNCDVLVNATPLGMSNHPPFPPICLSKVEAVVDCVVGSSGLVNSATRQGCYTVDGLAMFIQQAALQAALWLKTDAGFEPYIQTIPDTHPTPAAGQNR